MNKLLPFAFACLGLVACDPKQSAHEHPQDPADSGHAHEGEVTDLGSVTIAGKEFHMSLFGELEPGKEGALEAHVHGMGDDEVALLNVYLWIEGDDGAKLSSDVKGMASGHGLHFHVTPEKSDQAPARIGLRLREGSTEEKATVSLPRTDE